MTKRAGNQRSHEDGQTDLFGNAQTQTRSKARPPKAATALATAPRANQVSKATPPDALLNVRQAAVRLGLSKSTLDKMRGAGKGPRFVKTTDRAIRYDPVDLDRWINARRSASDKPS